uniref:RING-type E3 ubiquitin transferase n=1 Tax=Callithrix jacchus TaxID=9483 RepID=A0A8I3XCH4_CALJA
MDSLTEPRWPPGLAVMKTVDDLLRCGICFEYFNIAMIIPQCSHNYCSLCIRKFLSYKTQCPTCCVTVTEADLKNNRILDELESSVAVCFRVTTQISCFFLIKESCCQELLIKENESKFSPPKEASPAAKTKETRSVEEMAPGSSEAQRPETPSTSTLKQVTKVDCPVCGVNIPENHINKHLDSCLTREEKKESLRSSVYKRKPLPKTVYNLLSDRDLKKKLKEHGLSIQGNKQQLIKRHQEFVHMYNAQCDALHPKSAAEIVQEIENMERTRMRLEASKLNESVMVFTKDQTEKEIDEIHSKYRKKHKSEFQFLVDQARKEYKKTVGMSQETVTITKEDESTEKLSSICMGQEDNMTSVTNHFSQSKLDSPEILEPDREEDSSSCTDIQEALSSPESDSCNSSSSDIIRDLLEEEEAWEASHKNDLQDTEMSPRQNRRIRTPESAEIEPRNKRNRN